MTRKTVTSLALAAGCAIALAIPAAQAQTRVLTNGPQPTAGDYGSSAARNNAESAHYDRLLETSRAFRQARERKECGPITDPQLRENCFASFAQYEPSTGSPGMMTGSSSGTMNSTTTMGPTGYGYSPEMNGAGYGSANPNNRTVPLNRYGASRNLPAEYDAGAIQANGAMPNYPGPRPSGPLSGGGASGGAGGGAGGAGGGAGGM